MRNLILMCLSLLLTLGINAQEESSKRAEKMEKMEKKIEAKKIAYLSDKLELTPEEAQSFWPIYNVYNEEIKSLRNLEDIKPDSEPSDEKSEILLTKLLDSERQKLDIKENYITKFKSVIGADKTLRFFLFEKGFKREMLRDLKTRRERGFKERKKRMEKQEKRKDK